MYTYISLNEDLKIHNIWENCEFNTMFILSDSVFVMMERSQPGPNGNWLEDTMNSTWIFKYYILKL